MLSDGLFEIRQKLLKVIKYYSDEPWGSDYPNSQRANLTFALYHLQLAQMAYDSFEHPDNHDFTLKDKSKAMTRAEKEYYEAINQE
jgi:hypothetical protein